MSMLKRLEVALKGGPRALEALLEEVDFPHVEGRNVTFVYHGQAEEVMLHHWIHVLVPVGGSCPATPVPTRA